MPPHNDGACVFADAGAVLHLKDHDMDTILVKPWSADQGGHVVINAADFDPAVHQLLHAEPAADANESRQAAADSGADEAGQAAASPAPATRKRRAPTPAADKTEG